MVVDRAGVRLFAEVLGTGPETVFLTHGTLMDQSAFDIVAQGLARTWRVVRFDLRGHGQSEGDPAVDLDVHAEDAAAVLSATTDGPVHLVGHGLGADAVVRLAASRPDTIRSMTLLGWAPDGARPEVRARLDGWLQFGRWFGVRPVLGTVREALFGERFLLDQIRKPERDRWLDKLVDAGRPGMDGFHRWLTRPSQRADCRRVRCKTLVLRGERDALIRYADADSGARLFPSGRHATVLHAGHAAHVEEPEVVLGHIVRTCSA